MSHIATLKTEIKSIQSLRKACDALGLIFKEGQKTFRWYGKNGSCEHAIAADIPGSYEIGVQKNGEDYRLAYDNFHGGYGLEKVAGKGLNMLVRQYALEAATKEFQNQGYMIESTTEKDGQIQRVLTGF